ncbi:unnamed protein product [Gulo gulo]|uniref:Uncharacterized protein n=1 Tax=Gulo gulo TaxID=48420 RepID=A0A9X9M7V9_GULGU|nr:unnamed protein product [Gulo gulo]
MWLQPLVSGLVCSWYSRDPSCLEVEKARLIPT